MIQEILSKVKNKVDDAIVKKTTNDVIQIKFANSKVVVNKIWKTDEITMFLAKDKKVYLSSTLVTSKKDLEKFVSDSLNKLEKSPRKEDYFGIAEGPFKYKKIKYEKKLDSVDWIGLVNQAIDRARGRSAGVLYVTKTEEEILSNKSVHAKQTTTNLNFSIRVFGIDSGHGVSSSSLIKGFNPIKAAREASEIANMCNKVKQGKEGKYKVLLHPLISANLFSYFSYAFSAFEVDSDNSFLSGKIGKKVASNSVTIVDNAVKESSFDDEGRPTQKVKLIDNGILKTYLHNTSTAKKHKSKPTGSAGIIYPSARRIEIGKGDVSMDEMIEELKNGVYITNTWYTRFTNYKTGDFSTIPRDAIFEVKNGKIVSRLKGFRLVSSAPKVLNSIDAISKERQVVEWWEVETPVLTGAIIVKGVRLTRPFQK